MAKLLEIRDADVAFTSGFRGRATNAALSNVSLAIGGDVPTITAVVGESGSGKTTLIRLLLGFQAPTRGAVVYDGNPLTGMNRRERATFRREVQAIFQDPFDAFNPFYRVDHPLLAPIRAFRLAASRDEAYSKIEQSLVSVGLKPAETLGRYPHQLSGGQRQRVMIARALLSQPNVILADEPVSMVDASLRSTILEILYGLNRDRGIALIYVTHDLTTAYQVADSIVVLHGGRVMEVGSAEAVIHDPAHPYTRSLIEAVPSPDPTKPWNLDAQPPPVMPPRQALALYRTEPLRAVARPAGETGEITTAAAIQLAVGRAKQASMAGS